MAVKLTYKQIGKGVFGLQGLLDPEKSTETALGYIISGLNMSGESDTATLQNGFGATVGSTKFNSRISITFDGYYTSSASIPKIGDVLEFSASTNGVSIPNITIGATGTAIPACQIQNVDITASNTDYITVSISADYYPELPYITPEPPETP